MDLFFQLMLGAFLGAAAGYYTNTIALKKLFSNNGIIAREKDRFIDEISIMISKKIINYDSIYKEIIKDKFQKNIKEFFKKIKNQLISKTNIKIKNVTGFNESKYNIINWIKTDANENITTILNELSKNIKLEQIIDESQFRHIIKSITDSFISYDKNNHFISNTVNKIYKNNDEKYKDILKEIADNIINNLSNNNKKIESLLISLINNLNIENLFYDFFSYLSDKKIKESNELILKSHQYQTDLISKEASGETFVINLLFIHAQDHLMTAISEKNLINELIDILKINHK